MEYITSAFHAPLEAEGLCDPSIPQDEVEEVVGYARKYLPIVRSGTSCTHALTRAGGQTFSYCGSLCSVYHSPPAVLSNSSLS